MEEPTGSVSIKVNVVRRLDFCIEDNEDPPEPRQNTEGGKCGDWTLILLHTIECDVLSLLRREGAEEPWREGDVWFQQPWDKDR